MDIKQIRNKFLGNMSLIATSTGIRLVLGVVNIMVIVRNIAIEEVGIYILMQVIVSFFILASNLGLNVAASKFIVSASDDEKADWVKTFLVLKTGIAAATMLILFMVKPLLHLMFKSELLIRFFPFIMVCYIAQSFEYFFGHVLQGFYRYEKIAFVDVAVSILRLLLIIGLLVFFHMGLAGALYAFAVSLIVGSILLFPADILRGKFRVSYLEQIRKYSWPMAVENVLGFFEKKICGLIIVIFLGSASMAFFEIANRIPEHLQRIFDAFRSVFFPQIAELFSKGRKREAEDLIYHAVRGAGLVISFLVLLSGLFHKEIIVILFSAAYGHVSLIFFLLMLSAYFYFLSFSLGNILLGGGFSFISMVVHIVQVTVGLIISFILIPKLGLIGAVYGVFVMNTLPIMIILRILKRHDINIKKMILFKPLLPAVIPLGIYFIAAPQQLLVKLCFIIVFFVLSFLFSLVSKEDISILKKVISSRFSKLDLREINDV